MRRFEAGERFDPSTLAALEGLDFKARYLVEGFLAGQHASPFHGPSVEFFDHRDYEKGDDLRRLDWRLYARSDRLYVKRYRQETNAYVYLLCDTSASMAYRGTRAWGTKIDCARIVAAALTWLLLRQSDAVGLLTVDSGVPAFLAPSQRRAQLGQVLARLDALRPAGGACLPALLEHAVRLARRRSIVVLLSDLLEPSADAALMFKRLRFEGHECVVLQVLDGDEIDFPFTDATLFQDPETGEEREVLPTEIRATYIERFQAFMTTYADLFRGMEVQHAVVRTDDDPRQGLARFLTARRRL